ncbi:hypothetical protein [Treponema sp.]|uniref:hypothetical protein n=1 Tax=Treponema sp. TaxID=166 RepID=UPI00298E9BB1|nr:hypothetical protein [Treponema sp.]MCQ2241496.1 hypothetical protein [Treponema sp.]
MHSKKFFSGIINSIASVIFLFLAISCDNFLNGGKLVEQLEQEIEYANAQEIEFLILPETNQGTTTPNGNYKRKLGYYFDINFTSSENYKFEKWITVDYRTGTEIFDYVTFQDATAPSTSVKINKAYSYLKIVPKCSFIPAIDAIYPINSLYGVNCDSEISIVFNTKMESSQFNDFKYISITKTSAVSLSAEETQLINDDFTSDYFQKPILSMDGKTLSIKTNGAKRIISEGDAETLFNIIVTIKDGLKTEYGDAFSGYTHTYLINKGIEKVPPVIEEIRFAKTLEDVKNGTNQLSNNDFLNFTDTEYISNHLGTKIYVYVKAYDATSGINCVKASETYLQNLEGVNFSTAIPVPNNHFGTFIPLKENGVLTGYSEAFFEYELNSTEDGVISVEFKIEDNAGNKSVEQKKVAVIRDTKVPDARETRITTNFAPYSNVINNFGDYTFYVHGFDADKYAYGKKTELGELTYIITDEKEKPYTIKSVETVNNYSYIKLESFYDQHDYSNTTYGRNISNNSRAFTAFKDSDRDTVPFAAKITLSGIDSKHNNNLQIAIYDAAGNVIYNETESVIPGTVYSSGYDSFIERYILSSPYTESSDNKGYLGMTYYNYEKDYDMISVLKDSYIPSNYTIDEINGIVTTNDGKEYMNNHTGFGTINGELVEPFDELDCHYRIYKNDLFYNSVYRANMGQNIYDNMQTINSLQVISYFKKESSISYQYFAGYNKKYSELNGGVAAPARGQGITNITVEYDGMPSENMTVIIEYDKDLYKDCFISCNTISDYDRETDNYEFVYNSFTTKSTKITLPAYEARSSDSYGWTEKCLYYKFYLSYIDENNQIQEIPSSYTDIVYADIPDIQNTDFYPPQVKYADKLLAPYDSISAYDFSNRLTRFWLLYTSGATHTSDSNRVPIFGDTLTETVDGQQKPVYECWHDKVKPGYSSHSNYMTEAEIFKLPNHYHAKTASWPLGNQDFEFNRSIIDLSVLEQDVWYELFGRVYDTSGNYTQKSKLLRIKLMKPETNIFSSYVNENKNYSYHLNTSNIENYNNTSTENSKYYVCWNYDTTNKKWGNISYSLLHLSDWYVQYSKNHKDNFLRLLITNDTDNTIYAKVNIEYFSPDNWDAETKTYHNSSWTLADIFEGTNGVQYYTDQPMLIHTLYHEKNWGSDIDSWEMYGNEVNVLQTAPQGAQN